MAKFEVGKYYCPDGDGFPAVLILRRTDKSIFVHNGTAQWHMRIKHFQDGGEYAVDSSVPKRWRDELLYDARNAI